MTETVLEMHYHRPLMDLFRSTFGLGGNGGVNFYKYSPQRECFVGFDQAYAKTELTEAEFFDLLTRAASGAVPSLGDRFVGYFLQYKVVKEMRNWTRHTPSAILTRPHYRAELDTRKNAKTGLSQHELLFNLSKTLGAMVYYACPMLFDRSALYEIDVDLDTLRLADLNSCTSPYSDNESHFVYFDQVQSEPVWCSEPTQGRAISPEVMAAGLADRLRITASVTSAAALLKSLTDLESLGLSPQSDVLTGTTHRSILSLVAESLTVVRLTGSGGTKA